MGNLVGAAKALASQGLTIFYSGLISQEVIETLAQRIRVEIGGSDEAPKIVHALLMTFVELAQNVIHHGESVEKSSNIGELGHYGTLAAGKENGHYYVAAGSVMRKSERERVGQLFAGVNQLDACDLEKRYQEQKKLGRQAAGDRAGIGLFWVARRAGKPLEFTFEDYDSDHDLFSIKVTF
jgi:Family of unknown function (DUF6272)